MLPYPSGEPHIGHLKVYSVGDAVAHFHRRTGRRVLHPMGYDAFGLPAENHAIKTGQHPRDSTDAAIARVPASSFASGASRSTGRASSARTSRAYYRWTQWIFLELFKRGLAYQKEAAVNWDPGRGDRARQRAGHGRPRRAVAARSSRSASSTQWFFRITDYADRLLDDLDTIEWPEHVKTMQRNWIGRSRGRRGHVPLRGAAASTTRSSRRGPTRSSARRSSSMAPEHPDVLRLAEGTEHEEAVREYVNRALTRRQAAARRRRQAEDRRRRSGARSRTPSTASSCRCSSPTTC